MWLNPSAECVERLARVLAADEIAKAAQFHLERDRQQFIFGRGWLRTLLGLYLNREPDQVQFCYNAYGKPALAEAHWDHALCFNLAHSGELALCAVARGPAHGIGVDVEYIRPIPEADQIAASFFSDQERNRLEAIAADQKEKMFLNIWTRKEAWVKAMGQGLTLPLRQFDVWAGDTNELTGMAEDHAQAVRWTVQSFAPAAGYVGAVAVDGRGWQIKHTYHLPESFELVGRWM
jgi:4'-phosphopantetheinyl transferase